MPRRLDELDPAERHRAIVRTALLTLLSVIVVVGLYFLSPRDSFTERTAILRLGIGLVIFALVLLWEVSLILGADLPELKAIEAIGLALPLFLVVFSRLYLSISSANPDAFNEHLTHAGALYFTLSVFSTVGFGDIVAKSDRVRMLVSLQMVLDLLVIGFIVRLVFKAAQVGLARRAVLEAEQEASQD